MNKEIINSNQSGRSMIEMLGVLAIVGVLSVGGIAGYSKAMTKFKINKTIDQVSHIVANVRTLYAQQTSYDGLDDILRDGDSLGILPDELKAGIEAWSGNNNNPFGGNVDINVDHDIGNWFTISYNGLPKEACVALATYDWGDKDSSGLIAISVHSNFNWSGPYNALSYGNGCAMESGGEGIVACPGDANNPTPMSVSKAAQGCACTDNSCTVGWKFQ
jgi:type II secretory pathway pseudopilin PulG